MYTSNYIYIIHNTHIYNQLASDLKKILHVDNKPYQNLRPQLYTHSQNQHCNSAGTVMNEFTLQSFNGRARDSIIAKTKYFDSSLHKY